MRENTDENNNKNNDIVLKSRTFEMTGFDSNSRQDSFTSTGTASDSYNDNNEYLNLESQYSNGVFVNYFDYFMSVFLFANSFIYYSFINVVHLCYAFFLVFAKYSTVFNCFMKNKGRFTLLVLVIDLLYIIFKMIIDIMNKAKKEEILKGFIPENWASIYEYVIVSLIMLFLLIYLIAKDFSHSAFNNNDFIRNKRFLEKKIQNNNNILNSGIFLICFGCTIYPTTINFILLILGFVYFFCLLLGVTCRRFIKKHFRRYYITTVFLYIIYNYLINSKTIESDIGKVIIFEEEDNKNSKYIGITSFILFYIGFYCVNINIKVIQYIKYYRGDIFNEYTEEINDDNIDDIFNTKKVSITGKYIKTKDEKKLETLFATDIDCGIIVFTKECEKVRLPKKIKLFILKFCYTPGFCLHACRLSVILWINLYMTYVSLFLIIWLFFSIKYSTSKAFLYGTKYIIYPLLIILFLLSYISNIFVNNNFFSDKTKIYEYLGINENTENIVLNGINLSLKIVIVIFFQLFIRLKTKHSRNLRDNDIQEEIKKQQKQLEKKIEHDFKGRYVIKPFEIFFKLYFLVLDIAVVVFFYLSVTQTINILNEIVLLCIIALFLMGKGFMSHLYIYLLILNLIFFFKYILFFNNNTHKVKIESNNIKLFLTLLFNDNLNKIHYYWIAFYLLFLEYIGQTSKLFKLCKTKKFSIYEIVQYNLSSHEYIKFILETIFNFIFGIYIWLLIPCFIYCLLIRDNNVFGLCQLLIVFIIYYKYIKIVGIKFNSLSNIFTYTKILIISNVFNLTMLYAIQFLNKPPMSIWYNLTSEKGSINLELLGLFLFDENYQKNLFPYFTMFILSIALHHEITRQIKINTKDANIKNELQKYSLSYNDNDDKENDELDSKQEILLSDYKTKDNKKGDKYTVNNDKEYKNKRIEKIEKKIKENQKTKYIVKRLFIILYYLLHYYWIIIFIFVATLSLHWMLSVSMVIQLSIFCYYMIKSFKGYYTFLRSQYNEQKLNLNQKLKKYREEKQEHFKITSQVQHSYFNLIWIFTFIFIFLSYLCSIIIKFSLGPNNTNYIFNCPRDGSEDDYPSNKFLKMFISIMYFLGFFSAPQDKKKNTNFWSYTWGYFLTILLFSIRAYFLSKFAEIKVMYFNDEDPNKRKKRGYSKVSRQSKFLEIHDFEKVQKFSDVDDNVSFEYENYDNIKLDLSSLNHNETIDADYLINFSNTYFTENVFNNEINTKNKNEDNNENRMSLIQDMNEREGHKRFRDKFFKREYIEIMLEKKNYKYYKDDFDINYQKNIFNKNIEFNISVSKKFKKLIELLILLLIFLNVLLKCNILSFMFLIIILFTYNHKNINIQLFFKISYFILFLLILQYTVFVSNLSYLTNTFIDNEIISCIYYNLNIPWSNRLNYNMRWATFLSFGTNRYQVKTLWLDVCIVLILYFYLEFFSFTLYKEDYNKDELKFIYYKYNQKFKKLKTISKAEYNSFLRAMKVSYDIELQPSLKNKVIIDGKEINLNRVKKYNKQLLKIRYLFKNDKKYLFLNKTSKIKGYMKITNFFYISFHYIILSLTLILSLINQGLLAIGYICFSIFYIYKSHCFLKGRRWSLLYGINYFIKPYLFLDIVIQFIFQIPIDIYIKNNEILKDLNKVLGLVKISDYSSTSGVKVNEDVILVLLKILTYFLFLIQENLYLSFEFKKFILKYHYKYLQKAYIKGKLHSFLFNNYRVKLMNDRLTERKNIKHSLFNIQNTVNNWNTNLISYSNNDINDMQKDYSSLYEIPINQTSTYKKRGKGITIKKIIRKHWLLSLTLQIVESARSVDDEHFNIGGEVMKILQGNTVLYSYLLNLIDDFEKKNFEKYSDIKNLPKLLEEKNKLKKEKEKIKQKKKMKSIFDENDSIDEEEELLDKISRKKTINLKRFSFRRLLNTESDNKINEVEKEDEEDEKVEIIPKNKKKMIKSITTNNILFNSSSDEINHSSKELFKYKDPIPENEEFNIKEKNEKDSNENKKERYIKIDQPYDDMFFANWDYKELKSLIRQDFFQNCCSRKKIFFILIKAVFKFFGENFEYLAYSFMLLNHLINGSVTSLFYPIFIFLFGICQYPRPARLFWKITLVYTAFLIFLKFMLQLNVWEKIEGFKDILEDIKNDNLIFNLGLKKVDNTNFGNFLIYIFPDFSVLMIIIINQFILIRKGLWYSCETDYETIEESNDRIIKFNSKKKCNEIRIDADNKRVLPQNEIISLIGKIKQPKKYNIIKRISNF